MENAGPFHRVFHYTIFLSIVLLQLLWALFVKLHHVWPRVHGFKHVVV